MIRKHTPVRLPFVGGRAGDYARYFFVGGRAGAEADIEDDRSELRHRAKATMPPTIVYSWDQLHREAKIARTQHQLDTYYQDCQMPLVC